MLQLNFNFTYSLKQLCTMYLKCTVDSSLFFAKRKYAIKEIYDNISDEHSFFYKERQNFKSRKQSILFDILKSRWLNVWQVKVLKLNYIYSTKWSVGFLFVRVDERPWEQGCNKWNVTDCKTIGWFASIAFH